MLRKKNRNTLKIVVCSVVIISVAMGSIAVIKHFTYSDEESSALVKVCVLNERVYADDLMADADITVKEVAKEVVPDETISLTDITDAGRFRIELPQGVIVTKSMIYDNKDISNDLRLHNFPYVKLTDKVETGGYIDIRISFANGADYVLLSHKKVEDCSLYNEAEGIPNALWMEVSEEEIMRMSSAVVDAGMSEGCSIYAIKYINDSQQGAVVNYPVNTTIQSLIERDPNIVSKAADNVSAKLREDIDKHIEKQEKEGETVSDTNSKKEDDSLVYEEQKEEEIEFFD